MGSVELADAFQPRACRLQTHGELRGLAFIHIVAVPAETDEGDELVATVEGSCALTADLVAGEEEGEKVVPCFPLVVLSSMFPSAFATFERLVYVDRAGDAEDELVDSIAELTREIVEWRSLEAVSFLGNGVLVCRSRCSSCITRLLHFFRPFRLLLFLSCSLA